MGLWRRVTKISALLTAASTAIVLSAQPAAAVWPGANGQIVFWKADTSSQIFNGQIFSMNSHGGNHDQE